MVWIAVVIGVSKALRLVASRLQNGRGWTGAEAMATDPPELSFPVLKNERDFLGMVPFVRVSGGRAAGRSCGDMAMSGLLLRLRPRVLVGCKSELMFFRG